MHKNFDNVLLVPGLSVVIGAEPISNDSPNPSKQDCENKAAVKLLHRIKAAFPKTHFLISGDALYANRTFIQLCICYKWNYLFTLKRGAQPTLCDEFDQLRDHGLLDSSEVSYDKETGKVYWANEMEVILDSGLPMSILQYKTEKVIRKGTKRAVSKEFTHREYQMDMPELSKDHEKYDLDERKGRKKRGNAARKAGKMGEESDKIKKALKKVNREEAVSLDDADVSVKTKGTDVLKEGDVLEVTFMYITNTKINEHNICQLLLLGRSRWSIEEDFLRQKKGGIKLEHLRSLNENGMYIYFWLEQFADLMMQLYLYHSEVLKCAGTMDTVYDWLKDSFQHTSMEHSEYLSARVCLWNRNDAWKKHEAHRIAFYPADGTCRNSDSALDKTPKSSETKKIKKGNHQVDKKKEAEQGAASAQDNNGAAPVASAPAINEQGNAGRAKLINQNCRSARDEKSTPRGHRRELSEE